MTAIKKVSNLRLLSGVWKNHSNLVNFIETIKKDNGETFYFNFGSMSGYFLNDPEMVKIALMEKWASFPKSSRYKVLAPLIGNSILPSNGEIWRERRVLAQPIFQARIIASYQDVIEKEVKASVEKIKDGEVFDVYSHIAHFTFRVISKIMFSDDIDEVFEDFHKTVLRIQNECTKVALYPFPFMDKLPLPANINFRKLSGKIHKIIDDIIAKRLANPKAGEYKDLLSRYLAVIAAENKNFSMTELRNELVTMMIAGNETTALSISFAFMELGKKENLHFQKALCQEVSGLTLPAGEENIFQFFKQVPLMNKIMNETFRKYPAVWLFTREAASDQNLNGIEIKKGSMILISPYFLHRNSSHWKNPEEWNPDRFSKPYNEDAFIPFAKGPRMCIGMSLAQFEIQLYLYHFFKNFELESACDLHAIKPKGLVNLYPDRPILLKAIKR